jgi:VWFA-related protein
MPVSARTSAVLPWSMWPAVPAITFLITAILIVLPAVPAAAQDAAVFRADTVDVRLDVAVVNGKQPVEGLTKADFLIRDEGEPQTVRYFAHETEPLNLLLLLDISGSMTKYISQMAQTAREALGVLRPRDRVAIMVFGKSAEVHQEFSDNIGESARQIAHAVEDHDVGAGTLINAAVVSAAKYINQNAGSQGRRAILILSDNLSLNFQLTDRQTIAELNKADTVMNGILVGRAIRPSPPEPGHYENKDYTPADVFHLAEATGGEAIRADQPELTFREMVERIRARYTLAYPEPQSTKGRFRHVRVTLTPDALSRFPGAEVHTREGYFS